MSDLTVSYREAGRGPAIVFLHGLTGNSGVWVDQFEKLPARYRVIAWDAPGYGQSADLTTPKSDIGQYVAALASLLDALKVNRAHLVGHSIGAIVAAAFRRRHKERVASLSLVEPITGLGRLPEAMRDQAFRARKAEMESLGLKGFAARRGPATVATTAPQELIARAIESAAKLRIQGYLKAWEALCQADLFAELRGIDVPTLVVAGTDDSHAPRESCRQIAAGIRGAQFTVLQGVGHSAYLEAPEVLSATLEAFVQAAQRLPRPAPPPAARSQPAADRKGAGRKDAGRKDASAAKPAKPGRRAEPPAARAAKPARPAPKAAPQPAAKAAPKTAAKPVAKPVAKPKVKVAAAKGAPKQRISAPPKKAARPAAKPKPAAVKAKPKAAPPKRVKPAAKASSRRAAPSSSRPKAARRR
ncbi:MAG: alpha/beta fold hydrolase [Rhodospirillaceae bacterium]